jgi:isopropylmalate/homocitrate/citramalate synthase
MVGQAEPETVMGKGSGIDTVKEWLARMQIVVEDEKSMEVLMAVKDWGLIHKRLMSSEEFQALAKDVLGL